TGDVFRVSVESGVVKYYRNGGLFFTSGQVPSYPLHCAAVLDGSGATIGNAVISGAGEPPAVVNVLAPAARAVGKGGPTSSVTWSVSPAAGQDQVGPEAAGGSVDITLSLDGGTTWATIATGIAASAGAYSWSVPMARTLNALIQVNLIATDGSTASGTSG